LNTVLIFIPVCFNGHFHIASMLLVGSHFGVFTVEIPVTDVILLCLFLFYYIYIFASELVVFASFCEYLVVVLA